MDFYELSLLHVSAFHNSLLVLIDYFIFNLLLLTKIETLNLIDFEYNRILQ